MALKNIEMVRNNEYCGIKIRGLKSGDEAYIEFSNDDMNKFIKFIKIIENKEVTKLAWNLENNITKDSEG